MAANGRTRRVLHGDLGESIFSNIPVTELIAQRLEPTISLAICSIVIAIVIALPLGIIGASKVGTWVDYAVMAFAVLGFSVPVFIVAYLLIYVFSIKLQIFPVQGFSSISEGIWPFLRSVTLPSVALGLIYAALIARIMLLTSRVRK